MVVLKILEAGPVVCKVGHATKSGDIVVLMPSLCDTVVEQHDTALILACDMGLRTTALKLLDAGPAACQANLVGNCDGTALMLACRKGWAAVALKLLEDGTEVCNAWYANLRGNTARIWAQRNNLTEVLSILEEEADVTRVDSR